MTPRAAHLLPLGLACASLLTLAACSKAPTAAPANLPEVSVFTVQSGATELSTDIVSEVRAYREVELRPRVSGVVTHIDFAPGQKVKEGDRLFRIDPRAFEEGVINARANLAEAEANLVRIQQDIARYKPLLPDNAIPRQVYDQAVATEKQLRAVVTSRRAGLATAELERGYTDVRSPITGRIGLQRVEVGGLASAGQTVLATVSTLDPVAVYFNVSERDYLAFARRQQAAREAGKAPVERPIQLLLPDGSVHPSPGTLDFTDRALTSGTGTLAVRAIFANPDQLLRPGMNARVRIVYDVAQDALLVPQRAVTELLGRYFLTVVGEGDKVEQRPVTPGPRIGDQWLIESGLKAGDRVVVDGLQSARPGTVVVPRPYAADAAAAAAPKG
jgi:membrane fusion protein (multidrug efflux system)